jgi:hypothetical protein
MVDFSENRTPWARDWRPSATPADPGVVGRQILAGFEAGAVRALLHAACSSPTAVHHHASPRRSVGPVVRLPTARGERPATPGDFSRWINTVRAEVPGVTVQDDWIPCDPRLIVRAGMGGRRRPVHPGLLSRPQDLFPTVLEHAECIDPLLIDTLGFGLSDVAELAMRIMERERLALGPHWTGQRPTDPGDPAQVSGEEVQAAQRLLAGWADHAISAGLRSGCCCGCEDDLLAGEVFELADEVAFAAPSVDLRVVEVGSATSALLRPPPRARTRPASAVSASESSSAILRRIVVLDAPVASCTAVIPPRPHDFASVASAKRRSRSFNRGSSPASRAAIASNSADLSTGTG